MIKTVLNSNNIYFGKEHNKVRIKNLENMHCPACGYVMLTLPQIDEFIGSVSGKRNHGILTVVKNYETEDIFFDEPTSRPTFASGQQEVLDRLTNKISQNPQLSFMKVIQACKQDVFDKYGTDDERIIKKKISKSAREKGFPIQFIDKISALCSEEYADLFYLKNVNNRTKRDVFFRTLLFDKTVTKEHLLPRSKGGKSTLKNYFYDCKNCNESKGSRDFSSWVESIPDFEENFTNYLKELSMRLSKYEPQEVASYSTYISDVSETVKTLTDGKIDVSI